MADLRTEQDFDDETDDALMNDDIEFLEDDGDEEAVESPPRTRAFNLDMRHRIEERLEQRRLRRELEDYEYYDLDDDDETVH